MSECFAYGVSCSKYKLLFLTRCSIFWLGSRKSPPECCLMSTLKQSVVIEVKVTKLKHLILGYRKLDSFIATPKISINFFSPSAL